MLQPGSIIGGRLRVEQILGAGGMGVVVAATHLELGNQVAVKVLHDELAQNPTIVERFIREARAVVNLKTEHVCRVFDVGRLDNGAPYIVMEMLSGVDLQRTVAQKPLPPTIAVDYVLQACAAIAEAHAAGIIHRDIKPANLFVTRRLDGGPLVKVLDFGIAKAVDAAGPHLTHTTGMMGSPGYMSPEQLVSARDVDVRTDIWALGVTLYQLLSARMPFPAPTITEVAIKVASDPPAPLEVDPDLRAIVLRCLEKQPERRYPNVAALAGDLARFASSDGRKTAALAAQTTGVQTTPLAPVATNAPTAAGSVMAPAMTPTAGSPVTPPPLRAGTAPTEAAPAAPHAPVTPAPTSTPVTPARAKWPLLVGALALVGATVAVMLVITKRAPAPVATPSDAALVATTPSDALAPTPSDAGLSTDAAALAGAPTDGGDAWAPSPGASLTKDEAPEPAAPPADNTPPVTHDSDLGFVLAEGPQKEQMKKSCRQSLVTLDKTKPSPQMPAGILAMARVQCLCVLGEKAKAKEVLATITDPQIKLAATQACGMYGGFKL